MPLKGVNALRFQYKPTSSGRTFPSAALCTLLVLFLIFAAMSLISGVDPSSYPYNSYLLQAQAWLRGETALDQNYEFLELAVYNGRYYVSFPPYPPYPWCSTA